MKLECQKTRTVKAAQRSISISIILVSLSLFVLAVVIKNFLNLEVSKVLFKIFQLTKATATK